MARKTRADQHEVIKRRLDSSARWRDEMGYDGLWRRMTDLYRGKHWPRTTVNQEDLIAVNLAFSHDQCDCAVCVGEPSEDCGDAE
jgi:hypothetical protein